MKGDDNDAEEGVREGKIRWWWCSRHDKEWENDGNGRIIGIHYDE